MPHLYTNHKRDCDDLFRRDAIIVKSMHLGTLLCTFTKLDI